MYAGEDTYLQNHHAEKVDVGELGELVHQVLGDKVHHGILGSHNLVADKELVVCFTLIHLKRAKGLRCNV